MKCKEYIRDRFVFILIDWFAYFLVIMMLIAFKVNQSLIIAVGIVLLVCEVLVILIDYLRKKRFYDYLLMNVERLDKKYLVLETLWKPGFYEGKILYNTFYDINKSMNENVKNYELQINDFKDYIEMWIHEAKIPISSLTLMCHNHRNEIPKGIDEQVRRLDNYIEQVLYYVRSENFEKDCVINEVNLQQIIRTVILKNKDDLLENCIDVNIESIHTKILTDGKWLEFILNQIINNCMKYRRTDINSCIHIYGEKKEDTYILSIWDNGIGIPSKDKDYVFYKSYTGENGRRKTQSTGMGLYIVKQLCLKLGHQVSIESVENEYTCVHIIFSCCVTKL